jgi:predicted DCC family thiol-disulfide oxidoreductase YuxK
MNSTEKAIIFDNNCPMCQLYTQGFVQAGMLKPENRIAFTCLPEKYAEQIDLDRSRHEIALIDVQGGKTLYGLDSLLYVIGTRLPALARVARFAPFYFFFKILYAFVSYNRRVIIQAKPQAFDCAPDFHAGYRLAFIALAYVWGSLVFGIPIIYLLSITVGHYALPFLGKHQRTELLGQLAVSLLIACLLACLHPVMGWIAGALSYALRLRFWLNLPKL